MQSLVPARSTTTFCPGCYRLASTVRIIPQPKGGLALCSHPLRVLRLSSLMTSLLLHCREQRTCEQLAEHFNLPVKRVQALCEQLRWKELLVAGPMLPPTTWPCVSIIIPAYNRAEQLERCLRSLLALEYPMGCLELIVVDDASVDYTATMLQHISKQTIDHRQGRDFEIRYAGDHKGPLPAPHPPPPLQDGNPPSRPYDIQVIHHTQRQGVARSRNAGAEAAHHDLLAFIDSDCVASPSWLTELVPALQDANLGAVGGMIRAYERHSMLGRYEDTRSSLFMGTRPQQVRQEGPLTYLPTANLLVRRACWHTLGGFAPLPFGEDVDFCHSLLANGSNIIYLPQGIVYHDYRTTLPGFLHTRISYASSEAALLQRRSIQRRTLFLPPEQALFAGSLLGGMWLSTSSQSRLKLVVSLAPAAPPLAPVALSLASAVPPLAPTRGATTFFLTNPSGLAASNFALRRGRFIAPCIFFLISLLITIFGTFTRRQKVRQQNIPLNPFVIFVATLRGHLAYTYHLCRHFTRYYTLPLLLTGMLIPPALLLVVTLYSIVIGVDYVRLHPCMSLAEYILCSLLDDCAYEIGVVLGCIKHRTWKPLLPVINIQRKNTPK